MPIQYPTSTYVISPGQTSSGLVEGFHNFAYWNEIVLGGGAAVANEVNVSGHVYVSAGGVTTSDTISSGGYEVVSAGGAAYNPTVSSGGTIEFGGTLYGGTYDGAVNDVTLAEDIVVSGTTSQSIDAVATSNAVLSDISLAPDTELRVSGAAVYGVSMTQAYLTMWGGFVEGAVVSGGELADNSGMVSEATLVSGAQLFLGPGGSAQFVTVSSGANIFDQLQDLYAVISSGGEIEVVNNGVDIGTQVDSGGVIEVETRGSASATTLLAGALMSILGASATDVTVSGREIVVSGATTSTSVDSGGLLSLGPGGYVGEGCTVYGGGVLELSSLYVYSGYDFTLSSAYGSAVVDFVTLAGGSLVLDSAEVASGGVMSLAAGVKTGNVTVDAGGVLDGPGELSGDAPSYDYGLASGVALGDANGGFGELIVASSGVASAVKDLGDGDEIIVQSGGLAVKTRVAAAQATLLVKAGAQASGTVVAGVGAGELLFGSGHATVISSGGAAYVEAGGFAGADVVSNSGIERVLSGGAASGTKVLAGGTLSVGAGGTATNVVASSGGTVVDAGVLTHSGGAAAALGGVLSGKGQLVQDGPGKLTIGGTASGFTGQTVLSGGVVEIATAAGPKGAVVFTGSGRLTLDAADRPASGTVFSQTLSNFDAAKDGLDLAGLAKSAGANATLSGTTLTVVDGGYTAKFTLAGSGASQYVVGTDGAGGLLVHAAAGASVSPLVHAMAAFDAPAGPPGATPLLSAAGAPLPVFEAGLRSSGHAAPA